MANIDLVGMTRDKLKALIVDATAELTRTNNEAKERLIARFRAEAEAEGFSLSDLLLAAGVSHTAPRKAKGERSPVAPKYANPSNPAVTWTGRGRKPKWVQMLEATGGSLEDALIR